MIIEHRNASWSMRGHGLLIACLGRQVVFMGGSSSVVVDALGKSIGEEYRTMIRTGFVILVFTLWFMNVFLTSVFHISVKL